MGTGGEPNMLLLGSVDCRVRSKELDSVVLLTIRLLAQLASYPTYLLIDFPVHEVDMIRLVASRSEASSTRN